MRLGQDSAEQIRRHEVARALKKIDLSREKEEVIELLSRSLVSRLLHGPISNVMARAEVEISFGNRRSMYVSCELEWEGSGATSPRSKFDHRIGENRKLYITREFHIRSDQVSDNPT